VRGHENGLLMQLKRLGNNESLRSDSLSVHVELIVRMKCLHVRLQVVTIRAGLHNPSSIHSSRLTFTQQFGIFSDQIYRNRK
jgi:hypothetical protein